MTLSAIQVIPIHTDWNCFLLYHLWKENVRKNFVNFINTKKNLYIINLARGYLDGFFGCSINGNFDIKSQFEFNSIICLIQFLCESAKSSRKNCHVINIQFICLTPRSSTILCDMKFELMRKNTTIQFWRWFHKQSRMRTKADYCAFSISNTCCL